MGRICREFHQIQLDVHRGKLSGSFQLDELETFETHRLVRPVTVPILIEKRSYFVLHAESAPMAPRGKLRSNAQRIKEGDAAIHGKRRCGSREAVKRTLNLLREMLPKEQLLDIQTDRKSTYRSLIHLIFSDSLGCHIRESSRRRRDYSNVLFPINHTLAMMRDGISRLVRRSWGVSKLRQRLDDHLAIWIAYRNYVRGITVNAPAVTPAMALNILGKPSDAREILAWRWPRQMARRPRKQARFVGY